MTGCVLLYNAEDAIPNPAPSLALLSSMCIGSCALNGMIVLSAVFLAQPSQEVSLGSERAHDSYDALMPGSMQQYCSHRGRPGEVGDVDDLLQEERALLHDRAVVGAQALGDVSARQVRQNEHVALDYGRLALPEWGLVLHQHAGMSPTLVIPSTIAKSKPLQAVSWHPQDSSILKRNPDSRAACHETSNTMSEVMMPLRAASPAIMHTSQDA